MSLIKKSADTSSAPAPKKAKAPAKAKRGNLKPGEIKPLIMAARKAFEYQAALGLIDSESFDDWRRQKVADAVGKPGLTACHHADFRPLLSLFQALAGDDGAAFDNAMKGGKPTDHAAADDDREKRRQVAYTIGEAIKSHQFLAATPLENILDAATVAAAAAWREQTPEIPFPGLDASWVGAIMARKAAIAAKQPITPGYVVFLARQKTKRPDLTLGKDWQAGLAERCTVAQLRQILFTVTNRINAVEGVGSTKTRNRSQASPKAKQARATKGEQNRW